MAALSLLQESERGLDDDDEPNHITFTGTFSYQEI